MVRTQEELKAEARTETIKEVIEILEKLPSGSFYEHLSRKSVLSAITKLKENK